MSCFCEFCKPGYAIIVDTDMSALKRILGSEGWGKSDLIEKARKAVVKKFNENPSAFLKEAEYFPPLFRPLSGAKKV